MGPAPCGVSRSHVKKELVGLVEVTGGEFCPSEVELTTADGIFEDGDVCIGAGAVFTHDIEGVHRHAQGSLVVAFLDQNVGQATG